MLGEHSKFLPVTHSLHPSVCCLCHLLVQRTPPSHALSCFYSPAEHRCCSKPNTALEDPRNSLDTQPQSKTLWDRSQGQQSIRGTKPSSPQSRWEQSVPPVPGSLPGTSNNILKNCLHFVPEVQKVSQPMWKLVQHSCLEVHPQHGHSELGKNNSWVSFSTKSDVSATSRCFLLSTANTSPSPSTEGFKRTHPGYPPANSVEHLDTPCPRTQSLEKKLPRAAACPSNTYEWGEPGSQWQELELSRAFYFTTYFSSLKYSPTHPLLEPKLWFWDTSLGEELC